MKICKMDKSVLSWEIYLWEGKKVDIFIYPLGWWWACICFGSSDMFMRYYQESDYDGYIERHYNIGPIGIDIIEEIK